MSKEPRFLWLDVETTGLSPDLDTLLEVAVWPSRSADPFDLDPQDQRSWVVHVDGADVGRRLDEVTWRMHGTSGLLAEVYASKHDITTVAKEFEWVIDKYDGPWHPAGSSVHFDIAFLQRQMCRQAGRLHHRLLDVSAIAILARSLGMPDGPRKEPAHRAMADIHGSIERLRELSAWLRGAATSAPPPPTEEIK